MTDAEKESLLLEARIEGDSRYTLRTSAMAFAKGAEFALNMVRRDLMANGLTEAETNATPSFAGLTVKPWTTWTGGACPVNRNELVEIRYDGDPLGEIDVAGTYRWTWNDGGTRGDIVAYRVL